MEDDRPELECGVCGGTDFHKESGFYYCRECQTQSQEIREHVFERDISNTAKTHGKILGQRKSQKKTTELTSWECYNVVLKSLTDQMITLGADGSLKQVVKCLWMKYLNKCEVFSLDKEVRPRISLASSKRDIAVVYGLKKRKRARKRDSSESDATTDTILSKRQRTRKKMALLQSEYKELSQNMTQNSLMSETLSSLKSNSDKSKEITKIQYNTYSRKYLKKTMRKEHIKVHSKDLRRELKCHKMGYSKDCYKFAVGPSVVTVAKLYQILYYGLNIIRSDIQLGDMFRFIREGHLNYGAFYHLFPEDVKVQLRKHQHMFTFTVFRDQMAGLARFLDINTFIQTPSLVNLCSRYCKELNLPEEVFDYVEKLILKTQPLMTFNVESNRLPNYEGRAMSFILFTLKLLFGLDDVTEYKLSGYARVLNSMDLEYTMFNVQEWLRYIQYRIYVVEKYHLPTRLGRRKEFDSDLYLRYINDHKLNYKQGEYYIQKESKDYLQVLEKIMENRGNFNQEYPLVFAPSLTPFLSYCQFIVDSITIPCEKVLKEDFSENSLTFLSDPAKYLQLVRNRKIVNGGANTNIIIEEFMGFLSNKGSRSCVRKNKTVTVHVTDETLDNMDNYLNSQKPTFKTTDPQVLLHNWQKCRENVFEANRKLLGLTSNRDRRKQSTDYKEHYHPFERFWLNIPANPVHFDSYMANKDMDRYMQQTPYSFKIILNECCRIIEQSIGCLFSEYLITELNLVYGSKIANKVTNTATEIKLKTLLKSVASKW